MRALEEWVLTGGDEPPRMAVYVGLDTSETEAIRDAAIDVLGPEWFAIIEPGTTSDQEGPEIGFHVAAASHEQAIQLADERMRELRLVAGVGKTATLIRAIAPLSQGYVRAPARGDELD